MKNLLPKFDSNTNLEEYLSKLTKAELIIIAKKYNKQIVKYNKQQIIEELLKIRPRTKLVKLLKITWWDKWHEHFYGIIGVLGTIVTFISVCYPELLFSEQVEEKIIIKAALMSEEDALKYSENPDGLRNSYFTFRYQDTLINGNYHIKPCNDYLNRYYEEKKVIIEEFAWWEWIINPHNPIIDVKIVNNSNQTLFIDRIIAEVEKSVFDDRYLLLLHREQANTSSFLIINESWKQWEYFDFRFSFSKNPDAFDVKYKYSQRVNYFDFCYCFDLKPYLRKEGVNYEKLQQIALREFGYLYEQDYGLDLDIEKNIYLVVQDSSIMNEINECLPNMVNKADVNKGVYGGIPFVYLFGQIIFPNNTDTINVEGKIPITYGDGGASIDPVESFNMQLKTEGQNYCVDYPVSISIKPNEAERVTIQLSAPMSSFHKMRFKLDNINGIDVYSNDINIELFKEKSFVERRIEKLNEEEDE